MKILYWNIKNNEIDDYIADVVRENDIDIAIFSEYEGVSFDSVIRNLNNCYKQYDGFGGCEKVTLICKNPIQITVKREQNRYTLYSYDSGNYVYNIVGLHLPASPYADSNDRKCVIRDIIKDICEQENVLKSKKTIVIGDFNCNPFDEEVIEKDAFNAVLFKPVIRDKEVVIYNARERRRFYNPILHFLSEDTETYGSFYYSAGSNPLYWNSFDQILVRKELMDKIQSLQYVKQINGKSLISRLVPNKIISDHLPLYVNIEEGE